MYISCILYIHFSARQRRSIPMDRWRCFYTTIKAIISVSGYFPSGVVKVQRALWFNIISNIIYRESNFQHYRRSTDKTPILFNILARKIGYRGNRCYGQFCTQKIILYYINDLRTNVHSVSRKAIEFHGVSTVSLVQRTYKLIINEGEKERERMLYPHYVTGKLLLLIIFLFTRLLLRDLHVFHPYT